MVKTLNDAINERKDTLKSMYKWALENRLIHKIIVNSEKGNILEILIVGTKKQIDDYKLYQFETNLNNCLNLDTLFKWLYSRGMSGLCISHKGIKAAKDSYWLNNKFKKNNMIIDEDYLFIFAVLSQPEIFLNNSTYESAIEIIDTCCDYINEHITTNNM